MNKIPECLIHPVSIKLIKSGHPWVTTDQFSKKFPRHSEFVIATDERRRPIALLLNDPSHKNIKARVWSTKFPFEREAQHFTASIQARLDHAFEKRRNLKEISSRDNFYLVFGEADHLPGLHVLKLGERVLIQFYSQFWNKYKSIIQTTVQEIYPEISDENIWFQLRGETRELQKLPENSYDPEKKDEFSLQEFGIRYLIRLGTTYDIGLYTDMSSVRNDLSKYLDLKNKSVLNLFSYTGAFSLWAMRNGTKSTVSVDLSPKYIEWLHQNIALNPELDSSTHEAMTLSVDEALETLQSRNQFFDLIICDPPSSSSDGEKRVSAIKSYKDLLKKMNEVLVKGGKMLIFLNTHQVTNQKFEKTIIDYLRELNLSDHGTKSSGLVGLTRP